MLEDEVINEKMDYQREPIDQPLKRNNSDDIPISELSNLQQVSSHFGILQYCFLSDTGSTITHTKSDNIGRDPARSRSKSGDIQ